MYLTLLAGVSILTRAYCVFYLIAWQAKQDAQTKLRQMTADHSSAQDSLEEEQEAKAAMQKQLMAAKNDANLWKGKFENEATPRIEELEDAK